MDILTIAGRLGKLEDYYGHVGEDGLTGPTELASALIDLYNESKQGILMCEIIPIYAMYLEKTSNKEVFNKNPKNAKEEYSIKNEDFKPIIEKMKKDGKKEIQLTFRDYNSEYIELYPYNTENIIIRSISHSSFSISYEDCFITKGTHVPMPHDKLINIDKLDAVLTKLEKNIKHQETETNFKMKER